MSHPCADRSLVDEPHSPATVITQPSSSSFGFILQGCFSSASRRSFDLEKGPGWPPILEVTRDHPFLRWNQ